MLPYVDQSMSTSLIQAFSSSSVQLTLLPAVFEVPAQLTGASTDERTIFHFHKLPTLLAISDPQLQSS